MRNTGLHCLDFISIPSDYKKELTGCINRQGKNLNFWYVVSVRYTIF